MTPHEEHAASMKKLEEIIRDIYLRAGLRANTNAPMTPHEEIAALEAEIDRLRRELSEKERQLRAMRYEPDMTPKGWTAEGTEPPIVERAGGTDWARRRMIRRMIREFSGE